VAGCFCCWSHLPMSSPLFRASGQDLTTAGTYIEMTSRLSEPIPPGPDRPRRPQTA
jgi:hypothetical protein